MRKLIIWDMVTVDGFFEDPDRDIAGSSSKKNSRTIFVKPCKTPTR